MNLPVHDIRRVAEEQLSAVLRAGDPIGFAVQRIRPLSAPIGLPWVEVLVRNDYVSASDLVLAAERLNWIDRLDLKVAEDALSVMPSDVRVSLNVSGLSISNPSFADEYIDALEASGFPLAQVVLEVTETAEITNRMAATAFCARTSALGVRIAIDDYPGGKFPPLPMDMIHVVKFRYSDDPARLQNISELCAFLRQVNIATVAEHIETRRALQHAAQLGIDYSQGTLDEGGATPWPTRI